ncbi:MAG TPA: transketolase C-terminal domain-containing protein [Actinophytocola sp.]|uniref:alpha-ketoacid dehydrogenase subunit beta n=1 Tax=Actinophytocola sp. TaxID=1872138 RepID=UPI002DB70036|nr:transketolase C-terminal domain-containing protein [Actinophytocola sp.]HEU5471036.1 transketolase C-terminal domain-containing protein [Actinophytocola sp.]
MIALYTALVQALRRDPELVYLCTWQSPKFVDEFGPERIRSMPIAENAMLDFAVGLAAAGMRPVVDLARAAFLFTAMDPLVNQATKLRYMTGGQYSVPLTVRAQTRAAESLGPQHEHVPYAMLAQIPGLVVAVPGSAQAAAGLLATALRHPDPVVLLEAPALLADAPQWDGTPIAELPFGRVHVARPGTHLTIVAIGLAVRHSLQAADRLAERGVSAMVVDVRTVAPLDVAGLSEAAAATGDVLVVDDAPAPCSVASEITARLVTAQAVAPSRIRALNALPVPSPFSPALHREVFPNPESIERQALALLNGRSLT